MIVDGPAGGPAGRASTRRSRAARARRARPAAATCARGCGSWATPTTDGALRELLAWPAANLVPLPDTIDDVAGAMLEPLGVAHPRPPPRARPARRHGRGLRLRADRAAADPAGARRGRDDDRRHGPPAPPRRGRPAPGRGRGARRRTAPSATSLLEATGGRGVDAAIEIAGEDDAIETAIALARPAGTVVVAGIPAGDHSTITALDRPAQGPGPALLAADEPRLSRGRSPSSRPASSTSRALVSHRFAHRRLRGGVPDGRSARRPEGHARSVGPGAGARTWHPSLTTCPSHRSIGPSGRAPRPRRGDTMNPTAQLNRAGQSLWLDNITRDLLTSGTLAALHRRPGGHRPHLEPHDLRQGDRRDVRLRRCRPGGGRTRRDRRGDLLRARPRRPHPGRRPLPADPRPDGRGRRVRLAGGLAAPRLRRRGDGARGRPAARPGRPPEPLHQDPGHGRGPPGDRGHDLRRRPGERDPPLLAGALPGPGGGLHARDRAPRRGRPAGVRRVGRVGLHQPLGRGGRRIGPGRPPDAARASRSACAPTRTTGPSSRRTAGSGC